MAVTLAITAHNSKAHLARLLPQATGQGFNRVIVLDDASTDGSFAVRSQFFRKIGGFDPNFRMFHEGPDLCRRIRLAGHSVRFTTSITALHLDQHTGSDEDRRKHMAASMQYYISEYPKKLIKSFCKE